MAFVMEIIMKTWIAFIGLVVLSVTVSAQDYEGSKFEFGAGADGYGILGAVGGPSKNLGPEIYAEYRYGFNEHFSCGAKLSYKFGKVTTENYRETGMTKEVLCYHQPEMKFLAEYMILKAGLVRPYVGVNLGAGSLFETDHSSIDKTMYGLVGPSIGIQIWRLRLALNREYAFNAEKGFISDVSSYGITLGYVF